ncbi:3'(2'),5'-bisphosphate nucleotidase [Pseudenhygromyxa sp. WMMC2535]|uniref:3'(2'),5'-bisphosphate nucleotidase n=1 Tax=Pseudenhygromyxa sp. WMMC2535 TaxID=2712867 RepID=UPI001551926F|nr:3'(2'),5'-bisphosphate nucleotidase [Pseudenhygromyxa sp. WMMC2535]NVB42524.1 3'(2'),5'-bisphosphate nucleotidase [Pseudenhygromyxa sp. WMMC2535]
MSLERERSVAVAAVRTASRLCASVQRRLVAGATLAKGDRSPVTVADFGAQAVVSRLLTDAFPADPLVGEEDAGALRQPEHRALLQQVRAGVEEQLPGMGEGELLAAIDRGTHAGGATGRFWVLDPIDGTKGFLRLEQYAVALALVEDGQVVLGVLGCPNLPRRADAPEGPRGCLFLGVPGEGAWQLGLEAEEEDAAIAVDGLGEASRARFCESVESGHTDHSDAARIAERLGIDAPPLRMDSQCKYAAVARGDASIYLRLPTTRGGAERYIERIWDHAAGLAVIEGAGGRVSDVHGRALDFGRGRGLEVNEGVIVTNGGLHERVLAAVQAVIGRSS